MIYCYVMFAIIRACGIEHPDIVFNQYQVESGHGTSRIATEQNNYFGMRCVSKRLTNQQGCESGYGVYLGLLSSVRDYRMWQKRYASGMTRREYLSFLRSVYIDDKNYIK